MSYHQGDVTLILEKNVAKYILHFVSVDCLLHQQYKLFGWERVNERKFTSYQHHHKQTHSDVGPRCFVDPVHVLLKVGAMAISILKKCNTNAS